MSDNDQDGIENATHNTFAKLSLLFFRLQMHCVLCVTFAIPSCSLSLVNIVKFFVSVKIK
jgi:hypothetical protein